MAYVANNTVLSGTAYVGRLKNKYKGGKYLASQDDLLHGIFYTCSSTILDYMDLKKLADANGTVLYTNLVDRHNRESFTWEKCQAMLSVCPPIGGKCVKYHNEPMSVDHFAVVALKHRFLKDPLDFKFLKDK